MLLKQLIKKIPFEKKKLKIRGLSTNSKNIKKGYIFFAIKGERVDGEKFINEAITKGAKVIVCSNSSKFNHKDVLTIKTKNVRYLLSEISSKFYKLKPKNIIAVTGTNGKTSVSDLFYQILKLNKISVASIGTLGIKYKNKIIKTNLTSPDTISLHKFLEKLKKNKIDNVIIEASSHGLHQKRIDHLKLKAGIFTNFSQDHLDYHKSMRLYLSAKLQLFKKILPKKKTIISDNTLKEFAVLKKISSNRRLNLIDISKIERKLTNTNLKFNNFQFKNLSMAIEAAKLCDLNEKKIFNVLSKIKRVDGRLELVKSFCNNIKVFVDFAHTPDALINSLKALKTQGKNISIVFGCGGDRDTIKRPIMGKIADSYCKKIYVTDDNPRNENPDKIRKEIIKGIKHNIFFNIGNRSKAIKTSILNAIPNEIILIAGKGHEDKQIYKNRIIKISDKQIIKKVKIKIKKISNKNLNFIQNEDILKKLKKNIKIKKFHGISIDTRTIKKNNIFLTINGKNKHGFEYISKALQKGAKYIISSKRRGRYKDKIIFVENEIKFLKNFALRKRNASNAKIIAITGSAGKTSLKDLTKDLLQNFGSSFCSPKSYNNHLGVPLSLSQLDVNHKYAVFEVGMSKQGEINSLTKLIKPHIGIITNIGEAHIENFKNLKGIADAKGELLNNIQKNGTIILNRDDKFFNYLEKKAKLKNLKIITFGLDKKSDIYPYFKSKYKNFEIISVKVKDRIFKIKFRNLNIYNVLSSIALLNVLNLNINKTINYFKNYEPTEGRGKIHNIKRYKKNFKLIDESYNANPLSVKNAIKNFDLIKKQNFKKYLLLGDMLELGKKSEILHKNLSKVINKSDIDKVFVKGSKSLTTFKNIHKDKRGNIFQQEEDVDFTLNNIIANNDYIMIKGSNATGLNNLSKKMIKGQ